MKKTAILLFILSIMSCASAQRSESLEKCNENMKFKKFFFEKIHFIDSKMNAKQDKELKKALVVLSKYVKVSFKSMSNYGGTYPYGVYLKDRKNWLAWYEQNKCSFIEFKKSN
ncbi:hypothetical protein [Nonlabens tegetincola]|nr:hypothetical protein [Nonlabens tegetincola]